MESIPLDTNNICKIKSRRARRYQRVCELVQVGKPLDTREAALYLGLSPRTLEAYRCKGGGPSYQKLGRVVRYHSRELRKWRDDRVKNATSEY